MPRILAAWTAHPARRRPRDVALVVAVVATTMGAVLIGFRSAFLCGLAGALLLAAVAPFLLPTRYVLTDEAIEARRGLMRRRRRFTELRRLEIGGEAALVSPFRTPSPLDRYRGLVVLFDGADRELVVSTLRERIQ